MFSASDLYIYIYLTIIFLLASNEIKRAKATIYILKRIVRTRWIIQTGTKNLRCINQLNDKSFLLYNRLDLDDSCFFPPDQLRFIIIIFIVHTRTLYLRKGRLLFESLLSPMNFIFKYGCLVSNAFVYNIYI